MLKLANTHHSKYATEADRIRGDAFRKRRIEAGFSIVQVAARCGVHNTTLARLERGELVWHESHIADLEQSLDELIAHGRPIFPTRAQVKEIARLRRQGWGPHRISHAVDLDWKRIRKLIDDGRYEAWTGGSIRYLEVVK